MTSQPDDLRQPSHRIADDITIGVVSGAIEPGEKLASVSALMEQYGVANGTVQKAMRLLKDTGLIYSIQGQGSFVRSDINPEDFESSIGQQGSPMFQAILSRLDVIGDEISAINDRLAELERHRRGESLR